jgi:trans-2,3-dihydro-3-hydroxyanthranilate isomerase
MKTLNYYLLDVFSDKPFGGNQLAVFVNGTDLTTNQMQTIAKELKLSETVFILPPSIQDAEYKLRIFTPDVELPFAGHPTVGTAFLLGELGMVKTENGLTTITIEENIGPITIHIYVESGKVIKANMLQPIPKVIHVETDLPQIAKLLSLKVDDLSNLPIQTISAGIPFLYVPINTLEAMNNIQFRMDVWEEIFSKDENKRHVFTFSLETEHEETHVHSRMFAPAMGIAEDPATGSASGPLGFYLVNQGLIIGQENEYFIISEQGIEIGRPSMIEISITKGENSIQEVKVGGKAVIIGKGELYLPS